MIGGTLSVFRKGGYYGLCLVTGLIGALVTISLTGVAMSFVNGEPPQRETDALVRLLPLIGSSGASTAYLVGITGVLAPVLEENVFRGFLMVALTKWVPTPISIIISAAVFSAAHLTPGEFPQLLYSEQISALFQNEAFVSQFNTLVTKSIKASNVGGEEDEENENDDNEPSL